jgi:hypothetical protein
VIRKKCDDEKVLRKWQLVKSIAVLGSVLAQMALPIHASEISDKSETGREKHVSVPAKSSHFFTFNFFLYRRGQNVTFFGKDVTKNVTS